jgi:outer membrane lipoprotein-sorting protein
MIRIIFSMCCVSSVLMAQNAKATLEAFKNKYNTYKTIQGDFVNTLSTQGKNAQKKGSFKIKGDRYFVQLASNLLFFDGKQLVRYNQDDNEYETLEQEADAFNPKDLFQDYDKNFKYEQKADFVLDKENCFVFYLYPISKQKQKNYAHLEVYITKKDLLLKRFVTVSKDQTRFLIDISQLQFNQNMDDKIFSFDVSKYPGAEQL